MGDHVRFAVQRLGVGVVITAIALGTFLVLNLWDLGVCYLAGFLTGCLNLFLLTLFVLLITNTKYKRPVLLHRLFFIARYLLILNILMVSVKPMASEIIFFCVGLLCVNFSVIISSYKFRLNTREG